MSRGRRQLHIGILLVVLVGFLACIAEIVEHRSTVIISEVCSTNRTTAHDDEGDYGNDYIELYNVTDVPIDVGGYGISDSSTDLYKFILPNVTIAPHSAIVLWCDDKEQDISTYPEDYVVTDIHGLGFGISVGGESVYLTRPGHGIISQMTVESGISEGYTMQTYLEDDDDYVVGQATLYTMAESQEEIVTPEAAARLTSLEEPTFSVDGGWYEDDITVELASSEGEIYYTLDGSEPDENSLHYDGAITVTNRSSEPNVYAMISEQTTMNYYFHEDPIDKCTVIKAVAIDGDRRSSVAVRSYLVGLDSSAYEDVAVLSLTADPEDLFGEQDGIYVTGTVYNKRSASGGEISPYLDANYAQEGRGWERLAQIEFYTAEREEVLRQNVGIRIHGGWSTAYSQKGFNLYAREEYDGNETLQYDFFGNSYRRLMLRTGGFRDLLVTKIRDVLIQDLTSDLAFGTQQAMPCVVFLNGEYWGLYNLQEQVCEDYVEVHYGIPAEKVQVLKNPWIEEDGELPEGAETYMEIVEYAASHDLSLDENYEWIEERIDIESYIDYYCAEIYVANCDSVYNNYAMWRSTEVTDDEYGDGRWRWLLYDTDDSTGMVTVKTSADVDSFVGGHCTTDPMGDNGDTLFKSLVTNDEFRERFVTRFVEIADTTFDYEHVHEVLYELAEEYCDADVASQQRFRGDYSFSDYLTGADYDGWYTEENYWDDVQVIDDFFRERRDYIVSYLYEHLGGEE